MTGSQKELVFFGRNEVGPSLDERTRALSRSNPSCPLNACGAAERLLRPLRERAVVALGRRNRCDPFTVLLHGDPEAARRLVRAYAATLQLPYVGSTGWRVKTANDVLVRIASVCETTTFQTPDGYGTLELVPVWEAARPERLNGANFLVLPPCIVLIRDTDRLSGDVLHRLRIAACGDEPVLFASDWPADSSRVTWFFHCDDPADLPDELEDFPLLGTMR